jgi:hypothetical protein
MNLSQFNQFKRCLFYDDSIYNPVVERGPTIHIYIYIHTHIYTYIRIHIKLLGIDDILVTPNRPTFRGQAVRTA